MHIIGYEIRLERSMEIPIVLVLKLQTKISHFIPEPIRSHWLLLNREITWSDVWFSNHFVSLMEDGLEVE